MMRMMRVVLALGIFGVCQAGDLGVADRALAGDSNMCGFAAADAVNDVVHSTLFIWAASKRCTPGNDLECTIDVTSAVEAVSDTVGAILKVVKGCGDSLDGTEAGCGMQVNTLLGKTSGLAASVGLVTRSCPKKKKIEGWGRKKCVVNAGKMVTTGFKTTKMLMNIKSICDNSEDKADCAIHAVSIVGSFAEFASETMETINHCGGNKYLPENFNLECGAHSVKLIGKLHDVAAASAGLPKACKLGSDKKLRLFDSDTVAPATGNSVNLAFVFVLPIAMIVSFVGGTRFAKSRSDRTFATVRESEEQLELIGE